MILLPGVPMADYNFSTVEAALLESNLAVMRGLRDALGQVGIRKCHPYPTMQGVAEAFVSMPPDLVVIDLDAPESGGFKFIRWLRNDASFPNPFTAIIATTWQPTEILLQRFHGSGADALLVKPASPKQLMERVVSLVESRKPFVVTTDYVGPDRRKKPREGVQVPTLDPPNSLGMKAAGTWDRTTGRDQVAKGVAWINEQKAVRNAFHIAFLIEFALPGLNLSPPDSMAVDHVLRVTATADDLLKRVAGRKLDPRFETACKALMALVERVRRAPETPPSTADTAQLQTLALGMMLMLTPESTRDSLGKEVGNAASAYRRRLEQLLAAKAAHQTATKSE